MIFLGNVKELCQIILFCAACVKLGLAYVHKFKWQLEKLFEYVFDSEHPNVTQMWHLLINYVYVIIKDIGVWFSVRLPHHYNAWHWHSLCAVLSTNVGAWSMWTCSLFFSFIDASPICPIYPKNTPMVLILLCWNLVKL